VEGKEGTGEMKGRNKKQGTEGMERI